MATTRETRAAMTDDQRQGQFLRAGEATRTCLLALEETHHRLTRLYPQHHEYRATVERLHAGATELYREMDKEYARLFGEAEGELGKVLRRQVDWPVPWTAGKEIEG